MNKFFRVEVDIFGVPLEYKTVEARTSALARVVCQLQNIGVGLSSCIPFSDLHQMVAFGFVSIKAASYFLNGTVSLRQISYLNEFVKFYDECLTIGFKPSKCFTLWLNQKDVVENTFLFPLAELASKDEDFTSERERYSDNILLELKEI